MLVFGAWFLVFSCIYSYYYKIIIVIVIIYLVVKVGFVKCTVGWFSFIFVVGYGSGIVVNLF